MSRNSKYPGLAIALGAALGIICGVLAGNMGAWLAIGVAIGVAIGSTWRRRGPDCPQCAAIHRSHPEVQRRAS